LAMPFLREKETNSRTKVMRKMRRGRRRPRSLSGEITAGSICKAKRKEC